jgi:hypothetical protein
MNDRPKTSSTMTRRPLLGAASLSGVVLMTVPAWAQSMIDLLLPGDPDARAMTTAFPLKGPMILQRTRPPETPFEVFDRGIFPSDDQFYVGTGR